MLESKNLFYSACFKPLDVWMRFLGIRLDPFPSIPSASKGKAICLFSISLLMLFINASGNCYFFVMSFTATFQNPEKTLLRSSTSKIWSMIIDFGSHNLMAVGTHAALLAINRKQEWKSLWHNLEQLAAEHGQFFHSKSRRVVVIALSCLTTDIFVTVVRAVEMVVNDKGRSVTLILADVISLLSEIYAISGLAVFITIGWITSIRFEQLHNQLNLAHPIKPGNNSSSQRTTRRSSIDLRQWRRTFVTLTETVLHIGQCFGPFMLIWIVYIFISVIAISFYIVDGLRNEPRATNISVLIFIVLRHLVHLLLLTTIPVILKQKSLNISKPLRKMKFDEPLLQRQLDTMIMEVMQSPTTMTAMELFTVDLTLFPTLVGTSLTYLIILCQFQTGESQTKHLATK